MSEYRWLWNGLILGVAIWCVIIGVVVILLGL